MMISLKLLPDGKTRQFPKGTLLLDAILDMGVSIKSPCGGKGICGKCLTRIKGNLPEVTEIEAKILKNEKNMRLSCQTLLAGDAEVFIDENRFAERKTYPLKLTPWQIRMNPMPLPWMWARLPLIWIFSACRRVWFSNWIVF